jgi:hypothetical protein
VLGAFAYAPAPPVFTPSAPLLSIVPNRAATVELALGQNPNYLDETYPTAFNDQAVLGLQHHGYPWAALLRLAFDPGLVPSPEDAYYKQIAPEKRESLKGRFAQLRQRCARSLGRCRRQTPHRRTLG